MTVTSTKICAQCDRIYPRNRSFSKQQWAASRFCSRKCRGKSISGISAGPKPEIRIGKEIPCGECGKLFYAAPWMMRRRSGAKFCSKPCAYIGRELRATFEKGHPDLVPPEARGHTEETRRKISQVQRANSRRGPLSPNWRGGKRTERQAAMSKWEYKDWRASVFKRDNFTCQSCHVRGGELHADHIKPWSLFPDLRYEISNGRTMCVDRHRMTPTWGAKVLREVCHGV
jgi:5-methylcytosine-specific restriction endonuclease McrA